MGVGFNPYHLRLKSRRMNIGPVAALGVQRGQSAFPEHQHRIDPDKIRVVYNSVAVPAIAETKEAMKQAGASGGALGSAAELGTAIVEMQQHVDGLQKNIDVLKTVKAGLGG